MKILQNEFPKTDKLLFLDLEGTQYHHEIIEIGAILVSLDDEKRIDRSIPFKHLKVYCKPHEEVGKVVTDLTGITEDIISEKHRPVVIHRAILGTFDSNLRVVVFGNLDKTMLKYTASFYSLGDVAFSTSWFLAKRIWDFSTFISRYVVNMENGGKAFSQLKLMEIFSVLPCGQAHDSYNDAFNLLNLYDKVTKSPEILADNYLKILLNDSNKLKESNFMFEILKRIINGETITKNKLMELLIEYFEKIIKKYRK